MAKTVFIVGNGEVPRDLSEEVDNTEFVVRFNEPKASVGMTGVKTDLLFVNNTDKPMQRRLEDTAYWTSPIIQHTDKVVFVYCREAIRKYVRQPKWHRRLRGRKADWTAEALQAYWRVGIFVRILPLEEYESGFFELNLKPENAKRIFPSTGYFGIRHALAHHVEPDTVINICGFSFEGWGRHAWSQERQWLEDQRKRYNFKVW